MSNDAYSYSALRVEQKPGAPPFYITAASAAELLEWCDVPRSRSGYMAGYQRTLEEKRTTSLTDYLEEDPSNIVPGAVLIAVDSDHVSVTEQEGGLFTVDILPDTRDFETKLQELWGQFTTRLSEEELVDTNLYVSSMATPTADSEEDWDDSNEAAGAELLESESSEILTDSEDELFEEDFFSSYISQLTAELTLAIESWDDLPEPRQKAIQEYVEGTSKPGLIIDGQHRVFGAKDVAAYDVKLPVVLIPGLPHPEQVFQFYVLNSKAKPLSKTQLRRIVSTSLTLAEIDELYKRFRQAGIDAEEAQWTHQINTLPHSPFKGLIDFGFSQPGEVIKENVADQVVRQFMKMQRSRYGALTRPLGDLWDNPDSRLQIFIWFWNAIRETYADAWADAVQKAQQGVQAQLFMKVGLLTLQRFILDRIVTALPYRGNDAPPPFSSEEEVRDVIQSTLANLPGEFFTRPWQITQADTTQGRAFVMEQMEKAWTNQGKNLGNLALFKKP